MIKFMSFYNVLCFTRGSDINTYSLCIQRTAKYDISSNLEGLVRKRNEALSPTNKKKYDSRFASFVFDCEPRT